MAGDVLTDGGIDDLVSAQLQHMAPGNIAIFYVNQVVHAKQQQQRFEARALGGTFQTLPVSFLAFYGGLGRDEKEALLASCRAPAGAVVIFATADSFGVGVDLQGVVAATFVGMPASLTQLQQGAGRMGRGAAARAIADASAEARAVGIGVARVVWDGGAGGAMMRRLQERDPKSAEHKHVPSAVRVGRLRDARAALEVIRLLKGQCGTGCYTECKTRAMDGPALARPCWQVPGKPHCPFCLGRLEAARAWAARARAAAQEASTWAAVQAAEAAGEEAAMGMGRKRTREEAGLGEPEGMREKEEGGQGMDQGQVGTHDVFACLCRCWVAWLDRLDSAC